MCTTREDGDGEAWLQGLSHGPPSVCQPSPFEQRRSCIAEQSVQRQAMADTSNADGLGQIWRRRRSYSAKIKKKKKMKIMMMMMTMKKMMKKKMMRSPSSPPR